MGKRDDERVLFMLALWALWESVRPTLEKANAALQQGGADLFELTHPSQRAHMNDLPGHQLSREALLDLATRAGFADPQMAVAIALAESGGVPNALAQTERETSVGLWQINIKAWPEYTREYLADPGQNALAALHISKGGTDWRNWSTFKNGRYKLFLRRS